MCRTEHSAIGYGMAHAIEMARRGGGGIEQNTFLISLTEQVTFVLSKDNYHELQSQNHFFVILLLATDFKFYIFQI